MRIHVSGYVLKWVLPKAYGAILLLLLVCACGLAQDAGTTPQAGIDANGNLYVVGDGGNPIVMADKDHCLEAAVAVDGQTAGCLVSRGVGDEGLLPQLQVEIYLRGGRRVVLSPGGPVREWRFLNDGKQVAIAFGERDCPCFDVLFDSATGKLMERVEEPKDKSQLPEWAKGRAQLQDEAVPMSAALTQERTAWIGKVMDQIASIRPGMKRKDLAGILKTEGGLYWKTQGTYVHVDCPYIKVDIHFKPTAKEEPGADLLSPEDIIESLSRPYLAWSVMD